MEKILIALLFLLANIETTLARTGTVSDDDIIIWLPVMLLAVIWAGYIVKARFKERKNREAEMAINTNTGENSLFTESTEM